MKRNSKRILAACMASCLAFVYIVPAVAIACEGYVGELSGKEIAAGEATDKGAHAFNFKEGMIEKNVVCTSTYTWAQQPAAPALTISPSFTSCEYREKPATVSVGAHCRYRFNQPVPSGTRWVTTMDITVDHTGNSCEIKMELEGGACRVKILGGPPNEGMSEVLLENITTTKLKITPLVNPEYTSTNCNLPIKTTGTTLHGGFEELSGINIGTL